ncbi:transmembrane protein 248-like [Babylonia areolata]|uniref:transmembrane protein 248-like n=1 Tax=Babylonia areolata TaxID=304850 RepID=UPI003FD24B6E
MTFTLVENLRGFFVSRPPLVVFMICLASFAIALLSFAYIVKEREIRNPDITEDWNTFLKALSDLEYCVASEPGATISNASQEAVVPEQGIKNRLKQVTKQILSSDDDEEEEDESKAGVTSSPPTTAPAPTSASKIINVSVLMDLELMPTPNLQRVAARHNFTFITATLLGHQLQLTGSRKNLEANLTVPLPPLVNQSHQCQHGQCYKLRACVTFTAPKHFFPSTPFPEVEAGGRSCPKEAEGPDAGENHFHLEVTPSYIHCQNASILNLRHPHDPSLTVMLTMQQRSVINLHLMHTSYFLFVMIVTLLCYALIKGRAIKGKLVYSQCPTETNAAHHT